MLSNEFVKEIETDYLRTIAQLLRDGDMNMITAKLSAKDLLASLPFTSYEDIKIKIKLFTDKYPFLNKMYTNLLRYIEEEEEKKKQTT